MQQAAVLDGCSFDRFAPFQDGGPASEIDAGWGQIANALVVATLVVVVDEGAALALESPAQARSYDAEILFRRILLAYPAAVRPSAPARTTGSYSFPLGLRRAGNLP